MSPRFVELTHGTSGLLLAFLSIQIPMLVGLIRGRARLAQLVLSPVPAVVLTLIMGILMGLLAPLLTALGAPPDSGPDFTVATALCVAAGYAAGRLLTRRPSASPSHYRRGAVVANAAAASRAPPAARVARANGGSLRCDGALALAGLTVAEDDETKHFKIIGTTGTGKTTAIREMLRAALERGDRAVIADPDGGYLGRFLRRRPRGCDPQSLRARLGEVESARRDRQRLRRRPARPLPHHGPR